MTDICVTLRERSANATIAAARRSFASGFGIVEVRLDHFDRPSWTMEDQSAIKEAGLRDVITMRPGWEGGMFRGAEEDRGRILSDALRARPDYIDLESRMDVGMLSGIVDMASHLGVGTIVSHHDHSGTPEQSKMLEILENGFRRGAEIVKLSVRCGSIEDASSLVGLAMKYKGTGKKYSIMGMGPFGHVTRVLAPQMGCEMVYAKMDDPENTDQIDARTLRAIWEMLGE